MALKGIDLKGTAQIAALDVTSAKIGSSNGLLKTISGTVVQAVPDTDYLTPASNVARTDQLQTWTAEQVFKGARNVVFAITDAAGFEINPANGNFQTVTITANRTPTAPNFTTGQSVLIGVNSGANVVDWSSIGPTWIKPGGTATAPTLSATGYTWIVMWKINTVIYASEVGQP